MMSLTPVHYACRLRVARRHQRYVSHSSGSGGWPLHENGNRVREGACILHLLYSVWYMGICRILTLKAFKVLILREYIKARQLHARIHIAFFCISHFTNRRQQQQQ